MRNSYCDRFETFYPCIVRALCYQSATLSSEKKHCPWFTGRVYAFNASSGNKFRLAHAVVVHLPFSMLNVVQAVVTPGS